MLKAPHSHLSSFTTNVSIAAAGFGTTVTSAASANTYGTWTQINAGLTYPAEYFTVALSNNFTAATTQNAYVDIGIGATSGAVMPIIEKLCGSHAAPGFGKHYFIPIRIPPNTPIWARHQNTVASKNISVLLSTFGGSRNPYNFPNFPKAEALGAVTASTTGTAITPGVSAEGAWTQIGASTTADYGGFIVSGMFNVDTTMTANLVTSFDIGVGATGQERTIGENVLIQMPAGQAATANDERVISVAFPTLGGVPAGSRLVVRASGSTTADASNSVILLGLTN
jgi:hypothetical protein